MKNKGQPSQPLPKNRDAKREMEVQELKAAKARENS